MREYNKAMFNPNSLLAENITIVDKRGREVHSADNLTARHLVATGQYYCVTDEHISFT